MVDEGHRLKNSEASPQAMRAVAGHLVHTTFGNQAHACSHLLPSPGRRGCSKHCGACVCATACCSPARRCRWVWDGVSDLGYLFPCWTPMRAPSMRLILPAQHLTDISLPFCSMLCCAVVCRTI